jgi:phenylalanyl-tRNA synthetase beta chain
MANVKFNRKIFEKEIGKLTESLQEKIAMFGMTVESLDENEIELDITPDRPDLLSYYGFKRSFLSFLGKKTGLKKYKLNEGEKNYEVLVDSSVKDVRPFTACAIVKGIKFDDDKIKDIIELQEKLHSTIGRKRKKLAIGVYPLEKITLPINYKAVEPDKIKFIPLESNKEMSGLEILQRHPAGKEYAGLLAGKMKFPLFVDSKNNVLSMPPIINSEMTGRITEKTRDVFVECSGFDFEILSKCLNILVTVLFEMGGKVYKMKVKDKVTPDLNSQKFNLSIKNTNKLLGLDLKEKDLKSLLEKMGHSYQEGNVEVASYRVDILHEVDLIEDVAIAYGYDNFIPVIPEISTIGKEDPQSIIKRKISEILIGLQTLEISNYHLTKFDHQFTNMGFNDKKEIDFIAVEESKTEFNLLRQDLTHYLLKIISENIDSEYPQRIFELGRVFNLNSSKDLFESERLSFANVPGNFTDCKQVLDYLTNNLGLNVEIKNQENTELFFVEGRSGDIIFEGKKIGFIGEVHPKILKNWKIKMPVSLFEVSLERIFEKFK